MQIFKWDGEEVQMKVGDNLFNLGEIERDFRVGGGGVEMEV